MYFKRVKRKCGVRGCKNTDSYHISRSREVGNSVIICISCLENALSAIADNKLSHAEKYTKGTISAAKTAEILCPTCQKSFETEKGLKLHMKHCTDTQYDSKGE